MRTTVFVLCTLAVLAFGTSAFACMACVPDPINPATEHCEYEGFAQYCWFEPQEPEGTSTCFTTGRCSGGGGFPLAQLSSELTIASVEIRQGGSITTTNLLPVVAELPRRPADAR